MGTLDRKDPRIRGVDERPRDRDHTAQRTSPLSSPPAAARTSPAVPPPQRAPSRPWARSGRPDGRIALRCIGLFLLVTAVTGLLLGWTAGVFAGFLSLHLVARGIQLLEGRPRVEAHWNLQEEKRRARLHRLVRTRALAGPGTHAPRPVDAAPRAPSATPRRGRLGIGLGRNRRVPWAPLALLFVLAGAWLLWQLAAAESRQQSRERERLFEALDRSGQHASPRPHRAPAEHLVVVPVLPSERHARRSDLPPSHTPCHRRVGTVRVDDGVPLVGLPVLARTTDDAYTVAQTDATGAFVFETLPRALREVVVPAVAVLDDHAVLRWTVPTDASPIDLVLPRATTLFLYRSFPRDLVGGIEVRVATVDGARRGRGGWDPTDAMAIVVGAVVGRPHDVLCRHTASRRAALLECVQPGEEAFVSLLPATDVEGRVRLPAGLAAADLHCALTCRGLAFPVELRPDGRFTAPVLPVGTGWMLEVAAPGIEGRREVRVPIVVGSEVPIDVALDGGR